MRRIQSGRERGESGCGAVPAKLVYMVEKRDVGSKGGQGPKKQCTLPLPGQSCREGTRVGGVHAPLTTVQRDGFEMDKLRKNRGRRLRTPAWQSRIAIGRIADQRQIVGDRCGRDAELLEYTGLIQGDARPSIQLDDARASHTFESRAEGSA